MFCSDLASLGFSHPPDFVFRTAAEIRSMRHTQECQLEDQHYPTGISVDWLQCHPYLCHQTFGSRRIKVRWVGMSLSTIDL